MFGASSFVWSIYSYMRYGLFEAMLPDEPPTPQRSRPTTTPSTATRERTSSDLMDRIMLLVTYDNVYRFDNARLTELDTSEAFKKMLTKNIGQNSLVIKGSQLFTAKHNYVSVYDLTTGMLLGSHPLLFHDAGIGISRLTMRKNRVYGSDGRKIYTVTASGLRYLGESPHLMTRWAMLERKANTFDFCYSSGQGLAFSAHRCYYGTIVTDGTTSEADPTSEIGAIRGEVVGAHNGNVFVWTEQRQLIVYIDSVTAVQGYQFSENPLDFESCGSKVYLQFPNRLHVVDTKMRLVETVHPPPAGGRLVVWENCSGLN